MVNYKQIEKDNNKILDEVMETLEQALDSNPDKDGKYQFIIQDENGSHIEYKSREDHLEFMIEYVIDQLGEHNYFYTKEGIDKYEGECD
jgi:hypothetical protein